MEKEDKIYVAGHRGLVGSAVMRKLIEEGYKNIITRTREQLNLLDSNAVKKFFEENKPDYVFLCAAKVGGIMANKTKKAEFIYENLMIQINVIHNAYLFGVKKLLFLGSTCIYPKFASQPIKEEYLLTGILEETNDAYAIAKIAGIMMCKSYREQYGCNFISAMPTNLYGINDNFDLETSHVLPALIRKFHEAKIAGKNEVVIWGTGSPKREFLYVDDLADALLFLMKNYNEKEIINVGTGKDITIAELAELIKGIVGYEGNIIYDKSKPDGTYRKVTDITKLLSLGWRPKTTLEEGIKKTYQWFLENIDKIYLKERK